MKRSLNQGNSGPDSIVVQFSRQKSEDFLVSPKREAEWTGGSPVDGYAA